MGNRLTFLYHFYNVMIRGDGEGKAIRALVVPVQACRFSTLANPGTFKTEAL